MLALIWLLLVLGVSAMVDVYTRRVPNTLVLVGGLGVLVLQTWQQNWEPLSAVIGLLLGLILWQLKFIGGGDSKLLVLVSAVFAANNLPLLYLCISLVGAGQALFFLSFKKEKTLPYAVSVLGGTLIFAVFFSGYI